VQLKFDRRRSEATRIDYAVLLHNGARQEHRVVRKRCLRVSRDDLKETFGGAFAVAVSSAAAALAATEAADAAAIRGTVSAVASAPASIVEPANEPAQSPSPIDNTERRVYAAMKADPPHYGERGYARKIHERLGLDIDPHTTANLVSKYRSELEIHEKLPKNSRFLPKSPKLPRKR
jgi:hypothetical protein